MPISFCGVNAVPYRTVYKSPPKREKTVCVSQYCNDDYTKQNILEVERDENQNDNDLDNHALLLELQ